MEEPTQRPRRPKESVDLDVSVIVPVRNSAATLGIQLEALSLQAGGPTWGVVIVDNGSEDETLVVASHWANRLPSIRVVSADRRSGVSYARNVGAENAWGRLLLFCDADDRVGSTWVQSMWAGSTHYDAVGGPLEDSTLNSPLVRSWRFPMEEDRFPTSGNFLPYAWGANCGVKRGVFDALHGFNEAYHGGGDDNEFFWRLQLAGYSLGFLPSAVVHYRYRTGLGALARQYYRYGFAYPRLYRQFRSLGMPRSDSRSALRQWRTLATDAPRALLQPHLRGRWLQAAAFRLGHCSGSVGQRVVYL